jgi:hypothetical protein
MTDGHLVIPWLEVERPVPPYGQLNAKRITPQLYVAVDHEGRRHILLPLSGGETGFSDEKSRGLSVKERRLELDDHDARLFLDASCGDRKDNEAFDAVIADVARRLDGGDTPVGAVSVTLSRWRRFWDSGPVGGLSAEQMRGLFAELWFAARWLMPVDRSHIGSWFGPTGARHDFQWSDVSVEVKATNSARGHIHRINGLDQLVPPGRGCLYLFSMRLREEQGGKYTLPGMVEEIAKLLERDAAALDNFEQNLVRVGYSPIHAERYEETRFWVADQRLFAVTGRFPRITPESFVGGLLPGVEAVQYEINLGVCPDQCLASKPAELPHHFWP